MRIIIFSNILKKLLDFAGDPVWGCDPDVENTDVNYNSVQK